MAYFHCPRPKKLNSPWAQLKSGVKSHVQVLLLKSRRRVGIFFSSIFQQLPGEASLHPWPNVSCIWLRPSLSLSSTKNVEYKVTCRFCYLNLGNRWKCYWNQFFSNFHESHVRIHGRMSLVYDCELDSPWIQQKMWRIKSHAGFAT